jgi:hypothetical protein
VTPAGRFRALLVTAIGGARGSEAIAAAIATCLASDGYATLLVVVGEGVGRRRPTLLASPAARSCEERLGGRAAGASARGLICHLAAAAVDAGGLDTAADAIARCGGGKASVLLVEPPLWRPALEHRRLSIGAAVIRADLPRDRPLAALAVRDLRAAGIHAWVAKRSLGWAAGRRALAGVRVGGADDALLRRWTRALGPLQASSERPAF